MAHKIYFISDIHLGMYPLAKSLEREKILVKWMDDIMEDADALYFLGDTFDFWHEYKRVVPKGFTRFLGKLSEFNDKNIPVYMFTGNHDVWLYGYLHDECGVEIIKKPIIKEFYGKQFYMAHGDGLGPGDKGYLILKWAFNNKVLQWLFARLHPNFALWIGQNWSKNSRLAKGVYADFKGKNEWLVLYAQNLIKKDHFDYFIFGHRHLPMQIRLNDNSEFVCLGDWIIHFTYACFDGTSMELKSYKNDKINIYTSVN